MAIPFRLHAKAHQEFIEAFEWYELRQDGLGTRFMENVESRLNQISLHPEYYGKHYSNFRQVKVEGFPYMIEVSACDRTIGVSLADKRAG